MSENLDQELEALKNEFRRTQNDYLELMQSCLTGSLYRDPSQAPFGSMEFDSSNREHGLDWPAHAQTMIGEKRLSNLCQLVESVINDNVPGDFIETGVWRGGACILMRAVLYAHGIENRTVWVADSFEGLPRGNALKYPADADCSFHTYPQLAISLEEVQENFKEFGFLDDQTKFLKGWFKDTLPTAQIKQLALLRLDGDMYESTMDALVNLYPKLSCQGYVIIDDYHAVEACKLAVHDYCEKHDIRPEIIEIDGVGVYWRKSEQAEVNYAITTPQAITATPLETQTIRLNHAIADISQKAINLLNHSLVERDAQVATLNQSLAERDAMLLSLYSSTSWRVTKPLRDLIWFVSGTQSGNKNSEQ